MATTRVSAVFTRYGGENRRKINIFKIRVMPPVNALIVTSLIIKRCKAKQHKTKSRQKNWHIFKKINIFNEFNEYTIRLTGTGSHVVPGPR